MVNFIKKHFIRAAPEATVAIQGSVDYHLFFGFAMVGYVFDDVEVASEVFVDAVEF